MFIPLFIFRSMEPYHYTLSRLSVPLFTRPATATKEAETVHLSMMFKSRPLADRKAFYKAKVEIPTAKPLITYTFEFVALEVNMRTESNWQRDTLVSDIREYFITQLLRPSDLKACGLDDKLKWYEGIVDPAIDMDECMPALYMEGSSGYIAFFYDVDYNSIDADGEYVGHDDEFRYSPGNQLEYYDWADRRTQHRHHKAPRIIECGYHRYANQPMLPRGLTVDFCKKVVNISAKGLLQEAIDKAAKYETHLFK